MAPFTSMGSPYHVSSLMSVMSRLSFAGSRILLLLFLNMSPSIPFLMPSWASVFRYCSSSSIPSFFSSTLQLNSSGMLLGLLYGGFVCSSAIFRNSRYVSCST